MTRQSACLLAALACALAAPARADDAFRHHAYVPGETIQFDFEDTDTVFQTTATDGVIQAGPAVKVQEIRIPVSIEVSSGARGPQRRLTISPAARYRTGAPAVLSQAAFAPLAELDKNVPPSFSYSYRDDTDALNNLQNTFAAVRKGEIGSFLFYKMEDVHQMQESVEKFPEGMRPGDVSLSAGHEREGLGGKFVAAPAQIIYRSTETYEGTKAGYFKAVSLGHRFSLPSLKVYTNFFFTVHVALEGPRKGTLLFGEGQETATVLQEDAKGEFHPTAILQRQFSIRRSR